MFVRRYQEHMRSFAIPQPLKLAVLVSGILGGLVAYPAMAQEPPNAGTTLGTVKEPKVPLKPDPDIAIPPPSKPAPQPALKALPVQKVTVAKFKITGNVVFKEEILIPLISDQVGVELDFEGLRQTAEKISAYYRSKGYFLAQAYLPKQSIDPHNSVIEITVLEGHVGKVKLNMSSKEWKYLKESEAKDARLDKTRADGILSGIQSGDLVSEENLERSLLLLNDMPGAVVRSTLEPGEAVGTANAVVDLGDNDKYVSGSVEVDNWGSRYTGANRIGANININNPSGYGDLLSFRGLTSERNGTPLGRLSYVFPVGSNGTKLGASFSKLKYSLGDEFAALDMHGNATVGSVYALHPFTRSRNLNIFGLFGADIKKLQDIQGATTIDKKNLRMYKAGLSGDLRDTVFGGGLNSFSVAASGGNVDITDASVKLLDQSVNGYKTQGSFHKLNYEYQRVQALAGATSLYMNISGQQTTKNLASAEKFALGGPNGVRAYPVGEASADDGMLLNAELRWNMSQLGAILSTFVDGGHARIHHTPLVTDQNTRTITGFGIGASMESNGYFLRTSLAWRGGKSLPQADTKLKNPRAWLQFTKSF